MYSITALFLQDNNSGPFTGDIRIRLSLPPANDSVVSIAIAFNSCS